jgi:outer membrane protein OmpA-like peptidoglycan-associated protein
MLTSKISRLVFSLIVLLTFSSCMRPPNNDFHPSHRVVGTAGVGAIAGATVNGVTKGNVAAGAGMGLTAGIAVGSYMDSRQGLKYLLARRDIRVIEYGDIVTMWIPTDPYFDFNVADLNDVRYRSLNNIVKFIKTYPGATIHVAGFSDDAGTDRDQDSISDARAQMVLAYLWAHGVPLERLDSVGYGNHFTLGDDDYVEGSAWNRRIELQWRARSVII